MEFSKAGLHSRQYVLHRKRQILCLQKDSVNEPNVILPPQKPQPETANGANDAESAGDPHKTNMSDGAEYCTLDRIAVAIICLVFDTCERSRNDEEASEQYPCENSSEYIVQSRYGVQMKEHAHITGLDRGHAGEDLRPLRWRRCRWILFHFHFLGDGWAACLRRDRFK